MKYLHLGTNRYCNLLRETFFNTNFNYLFIAGFIPDDLWRHPGHGPREAHERAVLGPLPRRAEVADLDHVVLPDQNTAITTLVK